MRYDDRLITILELEAATPHARAVQWRQLVELLARGAGDDAPDLRGAALNRAEALKKSVPEMARAAAARAVAGPSLPLDVVTLFASDTLEVAAPVVTAATLDEAGWGAVRSAASPEVTTMLNAFRPATLQDVPLPAYVPPGILNRTEQAPPIEPAPAATPAAAGSDTRPVESSAFRWECDADGVIAWVEGAPRAALIGRNIADELGRTFQARLPFADETLAATDAGLLQQGWRWTGSPTFIPETGRFAGYRGVAALELDVPPAASEPPLAVDGDGLRELVHELRTPLNAIIGFGEIIEGQFLGPAHQIYRDRAAEIVRQARNLLNAVDDFDFAAKLQSGRAQAEERRNWSELFPAIRATLERMANERGVALTISLRSASERLPVARGLAERLVHRFTAAVLDNAAAGEQLDLVIDSVGRQIALAVDRPAGSLGYSAQQLLAAGQQKQGLGFALRLVRGLAVIAGGSLDIEPSRFVLLIPAARR